MPFRTFSKKKIAASGDLFAKQDAKAPADCITAYTDGGARGNPGPAGAGVFIQDANGKTLAEVSLYLGDHQTNNFAEYSALIAALEWALKHGHKCLRVISDSLLVVSQMNGAWKVKDANIRVLYDQAKQLARKLDYFEIKHVLRGGNKDADRLANEAMDKRKSSTV
jgi:ribonuclease HI